MSPVAAARAVAAFIREYRRARAHGDAAGLSDERTRAIIADWIYHYMRTGRPIRWEAILMPPQDRAGPHEQAVPQRARQMDALTSIDG